MKLPDGAPRVIEHRCNICGGKNRLEVGKFHRELATCSQCGSIPRFRGIIHVLAGFLGESDALYDWKTRRNIFGVGMSDSPAYADRLMKKFNYRNTFYDRAPQLDIMKLTGDHLAKYDFVISTEIFEHITPLLQLGFDNLFRIVKPGGCLVFSVPYTRAEHTVEHYPGFYDFEILNFHDKKILVNRDEFGHFQVYENLVFLGGEGATLEMRVFCEADILSRLAQSGFVDIHVHDQPQLTIGYYWPVLQSADPTEPPPVCLYYQCPLV